MSVLLLRLAGPLQSWSGYRLLVSKDSVVPTEAVPRKSGINGLIGAAVGSRDLDAIGARYELTVRVDASNPQCEDYQTLNALPGYHGPRQRGRATEVADRAERIRTATATAKMRDKRDGGNVVGGSYTSIGRKDYLAHSEFMVAIQTAADTAAEWLAAFREPVFMPYLGRKACAPTFPFLLGTAQAGPTTLLAEVPHVPRQDARRSGRRTALRVHHVAGGYDLHHTIPLAPVNPPAQTREEQMAWLSTHLSR